MKIALGAAKGLEILHEAEKPVIYRDFKASNILLDSVSPLIILPIRYLIRMDWSGIVDEMKFLILTYFV